MNHLFLLLFSLAQPGLLFAADPVPSPISSFLMIRKGRMHDFEQSAIPLTSRAYCEHYIGTLYPHLVVQTGVPTIAALTASSGGDQVDLGCVNELVQNWNRKITIQNPNPIVSDPSVTHRECAPGTHPIAVAQGWKWCLLLRPGNGNPQDRTLHESCPEGYKTQNRYGNQNICLAVRPLGPEFQPVPTSIYFAQENSRETIPVMPYFLEEAVRYLNRRLLAEYGAAAANGQPPKVETFCQNFLQAQIRTTENSRALSPLIGFTMRRIRTDAGYLHNFSETESSALISYMDDLFKYINPRIWMKQLDETDRRYLDAAVSALNRLPPYRGSVRRIATLPPEVLAQHRVGSIVTYDAFTSTSRNLRLQWDGNHTFTIESRNGRYVAPVAELFSNPSGEDEVLFPPGTRFKVLSRQPRPGGKIHFVLAEVEENGQESRPR